MSSPAEARATPTRLRPDREWLARLVGSGGEDVKRCIQCATCSAVCELADARQPGPRKEMLWAQWGLRDRLTRDPDIWLCHQCGDCTVRCPRGARPGDVMAALRRESIAHYSGLPALARWLNRPASLTWIALLAPVLLVVTAVAWQASGAAAVELAMGGVRMVVPFWTRLPHWLLGSLFLALAGFDVAILVRGARRFWRDLHATRAPAADAPALGVAVRAALRRIVWHDDFDRCATRRARRAHHLLVVYGMLALWLVSVWVATARWNPLQGGLVYPLGFWNPWKLLANLAGLAVAAGALLMLVERWRRPQTAGASRYFDLALLGFLLAIVATGFATEALHLLRVDALRYAAYVVHLTAVLGLFAVLPYSKLAHLAYRVVALVHAERTSRGPR